ncbi:hypothetical protein ACMA1D_30525 [Streptomyces sp. 796.1]|uniref:hypothetical protein n=1 Tax=Streptomyces sp. 796.1 TaxID=3163029 RepID=UPI0039C96A10
MDEPMPSAPARPGPPRTAEPSATVESSVPERDCGTQQAPQPPAQSPAAERLTDVERRPATGWPAARAPEGARRSIAGVTPLRPDGGAASGAAPLAGAAGAPARPGVPGPAAAPGAPAPAAPTEHAPVPGEVGEADAVDEAGAAGEPAESSGGEVQEGERGEQRERTAPLGVVRTPTDHPRVDAGLDRLADLDHLPVDGHLAVYEDVHQGLRDALDALDQRPGPGPRVPAPSPHDHRS